MYPFTKNPTKLIACAWGGLPACTWLKGIPAIAAALTLTFVSTAGRAADTADAGKACEALKGQMIGGGHIAGASLISPPPGRGDPFCKVTGRIHGTLGFEIHLPVQWNKKLFYAGGGGFDGVINASALSSSGNNNYVLVASDGGHQANVFDASWALNNPKAQKDFADLSIHTVLQAANIIVPKYYGSAIERRYFEGCSNGGHEALISATRFPHDFDGIIARAPAWNFTKLFLAFNRNVKQQLSSADAALTTGTLKTLGDTITAKCDALDGLKDGVVSNPAACTFDPAVLRCKKGEKNDQCLTDGQITTVNTVFSAGKFPDGTTYYPGWRPSGLEGFPYGLGSFLVASVPLPHQFDAGGPLPVFPHSTADGYLLQQGLLGSFMLGDPQYDTLKFKPEEHLPALNLLSTLLDATPDLSTFFALGNKLILWHGTGDAAISDQGSIQYFNAVAGAVGGAAARDASMEFFLAPGVSHCRGGPGPDTVDLLAPLAAWVEGGQRPSSGKLVTRKVDFATGKVSASRPLCSYPAYPHYAGRGDPNSAESFVCKAPADVVTKTGATKMNDSSKSQPVGKHAAAKPTATIDSDLTVRFAVTAPVSSELSAEAKQFLKEDVAKGGLAVDLRGGIKEVRAAIDEQVAKPNIAGWRSLYAVNIEPEIIAGVQTDVITPQSGPVSKDRVLINLHGGGFMVGARFGGQVESVPMAGIGRIKVITVDYRQAPEHRFPAGSEDVAAVYKELLKTYEAKNIGIYGCSAGGFLSAQAVAWFQAHKLPNPGAIGIMCAGGLPISTTSDSKAVWPSLSLLGAGGAPVSEVPHIYFQGVADDDPLAWPATSPAVLAKFPPTLVMASTRDPLMGNAILTHTRLVKAGVDAQLYIQEGLGHAFMASMPRTPEAIDAYTAAWKFFDAHLGR